MGAKEQDPCVRMGAVCVTNSSLLQSRYNCDLDLTVGRGDQLIVISASVGVLLARADGRARAGRTIVGRPRLPASQAQGTDRMAMRSVASGCVRPNGRR